MRMLATARSLSLENDIKRQKTRVLTTNSKKKGDWRFSADDVSMTSWRARGTEGDVEAELEASMDGHGGRWRTVAGLRGGPRGAGVGGGNATPW